MNEQDTSALGADTTTGPALTLTGMTANTCRSCWAEVDPSMRALHPRYCPGAPSPATVATLMAQADPREPGAAAATTAHSPATQAPGSPSTVASTSSARPVRQSRSQRPAAEVGPVGQWLLRKDFGVPRTVSVIVAIVLLAVTLVAGLANGWFGGGSSSSDDVWWDEGCASDASSLFPGAQEPGAYQHDMWLSYVRSCTDVVNQSSGG